VSHPLSKSRPLLIEIRFGRTLATNVRKESHYGRSSCETVVPPISPEGAAACSASVSVRRISPALAGDLGRRLAHRVNFLGLVLTSRRPASSLNLRHPSRWPSSPASTPSSQPFQCQYRFFDLLTFCAQLCNHFRDVHHWSLQVIKSAVSMSSERAKSGGTFTRLQIGHADVR
jgi:hypothetical protein